MHRIRCLGPNLLTSYAIGPVERVAITIAALNQVAMLVADALNYHRLAVLVALDVEGAAGTNSHPPPMCSRFEPPGDNRFHHVSGAKAVYPLFAHEKAPGKAKLI